MHPNTKNKLSGIRDKISAMMELFFDEPCSTTLYAFVDDEDAEIRVNLQTNIVIPFSDVTFLMLLASKFRCEGVITRDNAIYGCGQPLVISYTNFRGLE